MKEQTKYKISSNRYKSRKASLLLELLIAFGVLSTTLPLAFFFISKLIGEIQSAFQEIELREATINLKTFLDSSINALDPSLEKICIYTDTEGLFSVTFSENQNNAIIPRYFLAQRKKQIPLIQANHNKERILCSPRGGLWHISAKSLTH